jgi:uncharacterized protein (DUF1684 family)
MTSARWLLVLFGGAALAAVSTYEGEINQWRQARITRLKAEGGWLSLAGLFWLHDGTNPFGRDAGNEIVLPDGPARAGAFELHNGQVTVKQDGKSRPIKPDSDEFAKVGRLSLFVIKRGDKYGIRLKDPESQARREFHGIESFPVNERYRVTAKWVPEPRKIAILNILGQTEDSDCPGYAVFTLQAREYRLYPIIEEPGDTQLFYIFRDLTTGKETYGGGRFFYSEMPKDGKVVLDFNKAYNPPCVFTPYATCPVPPKENHLAVRIEAGEKKYGNH